MVLSTIIYIYLPQTKLRKGNVFTSVCQEFCPWGFIPACIEGVSAQGWCLPIRVSAQGLSDQGDVCPGGVCLGGVCLGVPAQGGVCPWGYLPRGYCSGGCLPRGCLLRGVDTPRRPLQCTVRILLEYILVCLFFYDCSGSTPATSVSQDLKLKYILHA